ncbi:MAG: phosphoribosylformylglycinamidine cyclo-ligase [Veillonella sp.]|nr:phosphoribosylformylglycinamidine cyclo-ligase [Veillonella sp.]
MCSNKNSLTYRDAGVDIDAGNRAVELMKESVKRTYTPGVVGDLGGFGGLYSLAGHAMSDPMLVSGTDGVGTKLRLAIMMDKHDMAGFYDDEDYDVAGFAVGIVDRPKLITGESIKAGDVILGLPSSGVHSNGFSLVRKIVFDHKGFSIGQDIPEFGKTLGEELLTPTRLYHKAVLPLIKESLLKGMVHITGGGFYENIPRVLPAGVTAEVDCDTWPRLPVFEKLQEWGNVDWHEMYRTFNMGIGMILIVDAADVDRVKANLESRNEAVYEIGHIVKGEGPVVVKGAVFND